jgi:hypothetical protein
MRLLSETPYFTLSVDGSAAIVRVARTSQRIPMEAVSGILSPLSDALDTATVVPRDFGLLLDVSAAGANNDPDFEKAMNAQVMPFIAQFRAYVVLVKSAVGVLHVNRLVRSARPRDHDHVFRDEQQAIARLTALLDRSP